MKKNKLLIILTMILTIGLSLGAITACEKKHTHSYTKMVVEEQFLASEATCSQKAKYYKSCKCGEMGSDIFEYGETKPHDYETLNRSQTEHWYECKCGDKYGVEQHTSSGAATEFKEEICTKCNYVIKEAWGHEHSLFLTKVEKKESTCTETGNVEYYVCECGKWFTNSKATVEITEKSSVIKAKKKHSFVNEIVEDRYKESEASCSKRITYYKSCDCGEKGTVTFEYGDYKNHNYENSEKCVDCGYLKATEGIEYVLSSDEESYCVRSIGTATDKDIVIASVYNNKPVKVIKKTAFYNCKNLTSITLPNNVTTINEGAFYGCSSLTSITLPFIGKNRKSTGSMYQYPFGYIFGTKSYVGSTKVSQRYYTADATKNAYSTYYIPTSLKKVTITGGNVYYGAFQNCSRLTDILIPQSATVIGGSAFDGCSSLTSISIGDKVIDIGSWVFDGCDSLERIDVAEENSVYCSKDGILYNLQLKSIMFIPSKISGNISILEGITNIEDAAFWGCTNLTGVTISSSIKIIGNWAFWGCENLANIKVEDGNRNYKAIDGNLYSIDGTHLLQYAVGKKDKNFTVPDTVTSIGHGAFYGCNNLVKLELPFIGAAKGGTIDTNFGYIFGTRGDVQNAKYVPMSLKEVVITSSTSIDNSAFYECSSLVSITIPDSVASIGNDAFLGCISLENIIVHKDNEYFVSIDGNLYSKDETKLIQYAVGKKDESFTVLDTVTNISYGAFYGCSYLMSVTIPDSVTVIGNAAFRECINLSNVEIGNGVSTIGYQAFYGCKELKSITIGSGLTHILGYVFFNCDNLTDIYYKGTASDWAKVSVADGNTELKSAKVHYEQ